MADVNEETRAQRIARYKEERRRQYSIRYERLLVQNNLQYEQQQQKRTVAKDANSSCATTEGPRLNRASRFRAAATAGQDAIKEVHNLMQNTISCIGNNYERIAVLHIAYSLLVVLFSGCVYIVIQMLYYIR